MLTDEQKKELEEQFNHYSYLAEKNKRYLGYDDCSELYRRNIAIMEALREALKVLGYTFEQAHTEKHIGLEYWAYKLVKV